jgi:hypothetical protein
MVSTNPRVSRTAWGGVLEIQPAYEDIGKPYYNGVPFYYGTFFTPQSFLFFELTEIGRKYTRESYGGARRIEFNPTYSEFQEFNPEEFVSYMVEYPKFIAYTFVGVYGFQNIEHNPWNGVVFNMRRKLKKRYRFYRVGQAPTDYIEELYYQTASYGFNAANNPINIGVNPDGTYKNTIVVDGPSLVVSRLNGNTSVTNSLIYEETTTTVSETIGGITYPANWYIESVTVPPFYQT